MFLGRPALKGLELSHVSRGLLFLMRLSFGAAVSQRNQSATFGVEVASTMEASMRGFIIGALVVGVGVVGFLYWDSQHNTVFKAPGVEIKKN